MKKKLFLSTLLVCLLLLAACNSLGGKDDDELSPPAVIIELDEDQTSMRALWNVTGYVLGVNFKGDEADAMAVVFEPLDIREDQITFMKKRCQGVIFREEKVDATQFLADNWQITAKDLGIEGVEEFTRVTTNCDLFGFREYVRLNDLRLVVPFEDVFYLLTPTAMR